jgi:single-strand DNA-binding protein
MSDYKATGTILHIGKVQQVTEKLTKLEFVINIDGQYPQTPKFELVNLRCDLIAAYEVGDQIDVWFNLKGRPYTKNGETTYFTSLEAWKIQRVQGTQSSKQKPQQQPSAQQQPPAIVKEGGEKQPDDDLPF